ncbi:MAG: rhomboid family intramembrane serine protease [Alphaproteobacteria bacterium]|nr:rhomboid family intramembrane serine protease [Alphaproteobacteria bacterium]
MHEDDDQKNEGDKDDKNIIHFPSSRERKKQKTFLNKARSKRSREDQDREKLEARYRAEYAKQRSQMARQSAGGKEPFINWEKVPIFVRYFAGLILAVHILIYFFVKPEDMTVFLYKFGFVPGYYTGVLEWSNFALIGPFTSIILHTGWIHLIANLLMFVILGSLFEQNYGFKYTFALFLASALCGHLFCLVYSPFSTATVVGASSGISGLFGAVLIIIDQRRREMGGYEGQWLIPVILIWICLIIGRGLLSPDIAWQGHLGGFLGGLLLFHLWQKGKLRF